MNRKRSAVGKQDGGVFSSSVNSKEIQHLITHQIASCRFKCFICLYSLLFYVMSVIREELVAILEEKLDEKFKTLEAKLTEHLEEKLSPLRKSIEETVTSARFINAKYVEAMKKLKAAEDDMRALRTTIGKLSDSLQVLKRPHNDLEQYGRREAVEIRGIPMPNSKDVVENTNEIVQNIGNLMGVYVSEHDLSVSHRMPVSERYKGKHSDPPAIIANFTRRDVKEKFYDAKAKLHDVSTLDLGYSDDNNIYISESLTESNRELFKLCLKAKKDLRFNFIWTRIFMWKDKEAPAVLIKSIDELQELRQEMR